MLEAVQLPAVEVVWWDDCTPVRVVVVVGVSFSLVFVVE
jgi:hypothetical protein